MLSRIFALTTSSGTEETTVQALSDPGTVVFGIAIMVVAVFLMVAIMLQSSKDKGLSGTIAGNADTFFSKSKGHTLDKILSKLTLVISIVFAILVIAMYIYIS